MAAPEKMRIYAIITMTAMEPPFLDFEDFDAIRQFISEHEIAYRALPSKLRSVKREESNSFIFLCRM